MPTIVCKLCLKETSKLVDSHIIPRAFYEEYRKKRMIVLSQNEAVTKRVNKGLYGQFLCELCEERFNQYDEPCVEYFKKATNHQSLIKVHNNEVFVIRDVFEKKDVIHKFALTVLWRAAVCGREEFSSIRLGKYQEKIRAAIDKSSFDTDLLEATGVMFWKYRGSTDVDSAFIPYHLHQKNDHFKHSFGVFYCHDFGFPYGEIHIRLGGDKPKQGYVTCDGYKSVMWSCNLNRDYSNLFCAKITSNPDVESILQQKYTINN